MSLVARLLCVLLLLSATACSTLGDAQRERAAGIAVSARQTGVACQEPDRCAAASELHALGAAALAQSQAGGEASPRHFVLILDEGGDALLARLNLIRAARDRIDLQTYIFDRDDSARLVIDELLAAARRGIRVRVLIDQLSAINDLHVLAALAGAHQNLEVRVYNPSFGRAISSYLDYAASVICCFRRFNQRMHNKLLLVDSRVAIAGGRNYQDDYYDWDAEYNFRDRDLLVAGPVGADMAANFEAFWSSRRSVPAEQLGDVARPLRKQGAPPPPHAPYRKPERVRALLAMVDDEAAIRARFVDPAMPVRGVQFIADLPVKHWQGRPAEANAAAEAASSGLRTLIAGARDEVLLQTPYLVLSKPAQHLFRELHRQEDAPRVRISTNSLASTDAFIAYAISHKYKRRYLRDFGFEIHEFKPFPADAPFEFGALGADLPDVDEAVPPATAPAASTRRPSLRERRLAQRGLRADPASEAGRFRALGSGGMPVRLKQAGMRMGLHAKSMVVDGKVGVVGTHNFDPRGDIYNTESAVVIGDPAFARRLAASIERDMAPGNAWTIGRRDSSKILPGIEFTLARISERMPLFDLWPVKYATSYEFVPGPDCPTPPSPFDPAFRGCHRPVGDSPEVDIGLKWLGVRVFTAFGSGLSPIL